MYTPAPRRLNQTRSLSALFMFYALIIMIDHFDQLPTLHTTENRSWLPGKKHFSSAKDHHPAVGAWTRVFELKHARHGRPPELPRNRISEQQPLDTLSEITPA